jgi:division protein CdvB (Snf7/Vps24/ESCRT-III family)
MTSSVSLIIAMLMFVFVWQPIWTEGFEDFHTVSTAIDNLNKTAKPASDTIPLMLAEMNKMNKNMYEMNKHMHEMYKMNTNMYEMQNTMRDMSASMGNIEKMTPNIKRMTLSIEQMTMVLSTELPRISFMMGRLDNKMPDMDFMPFR